MTDVRLARQGISWRISSVRINISFITDPQINIPNGSLWPHAVEEEGENVDRSAEAVTVAR